MPNLEERQMGAVARGWSWEFDGNVRIDVLPRPSWAQGRLRTTFVYIVPPQNRICRNGSIKIFIFNRG